jgi:threonine dehydrogenase-like Zn-dependent dehydrogenase
MVLFLSDIFPTGYMAAENAGIEKGDTVAVWGCGPVAQMCIQSCWMLGAGRVKLAVWSEHKEVACVP